MGDWLEAYAQIMELDYWAASPCVGARWDETRREWEVAVDRPEGRLLLRPKQLVFATGSYGPPHMPKVDGADTFADLSPEEQTVVAATQGPFHIRTLTAPMSQVAWREKPTFMVVATKDMIIPPQMERDQVKAAKATAIEVPSSHVAMLSFPKEVAELIIKAAE
jgi:pimeloyl-ACP methyl ester carboxylesterase